LDVNVVEVWALSLAFLSVDTGRTDNRWREQGNMALWLHMLPNLTFHMFVKRTEYGIKVPVQLSHSFEDNYVASKTEW